MERFEHDGVGLAYRRSGSPAGPALLLLHGLSGSLASYSEVARAFDDRADVYALDFRGHGHSGRAPGTYTLPALVGDVVAFLESVVGRPAIVAGHSLGAVTTFALAASRPDLVTSALCEDPPLFFNEQANFESSVFGTLFPLVRDQMKRVQASGASRAEVFEMLAKQPYPGGGQARDHQTAETIEARAEAFLLCDPEVWDPAIEGTFLSGYDPDARITVPMVVLQADPALGPALFPEHAERLRRSNPDARIHCVAGAPHGIRTHRATTAEYISHLESLFDCGIGAARHSESHQPRAMPQLRP
jgi:pimeloyl-ACP methyl ester carboxylesterase